MLYYILLTPNPESHTNTAEISMQGNKIIKKTWIFKSFLLSACSKSQNLLSFQLITAYSLPNKTRKIKGFQMRLEYKLVLFHYNVSSWNCMHNLCECSYAHFLQWIRVLYQIFRRISVPKKTLRTTDLAHQKIQISRK